MLPLCRSIFSLCIPKITSPSTGLVGKHDVLCVVNFFARLFSVPFLRQERYKDISEAEKGPILPFELHFTHPVSEGFFACVPIWWSSQIMFIQHWVRTVRLLLVCLWWGFMMMLQAADYYHTRFEGFVCVCFLFKLTIPKIFPLPPKITQPNSVSMAAARYGSYTKNLLHAVWKRTKTKKKELENQIIFQSGDFLFPAGKTKTGNSHDAPNEPIFMHAHITQTLTSSLTLLHRRRRVWWNHIFMNCIYIFHSLHIAHRIE